MAPDHDARASTLNETSIKPVGYGERFVKRRGLFSLSVASTQVSSLRRPEGQ
jgi:hypothetical protein